MAEREKNTIVIMDFSGIYRQEHFHEKQPVSWVEVQDITGTNCYCDDEAKVEIQKRIADLTPEGIHFIDSGNYHYMSRIWLEKIEEPFRLLVFDNHTDMQLPTFGGLLSCGGWIAAALEELPNLKEVILVGPDEEAFSQVESWMQEKVCFLSREALLQKKEEEKTAFFEKIKTDLPLYISVDKDVLCEEDASATWSQGDMKLSELERYLETVLTVFSDEEQRVTGMDVCGECDAEAAGDHGLNDVANAVLLKLWKKQGEKYEK